MAETSTQQPISRADVGLRSERGPILLAVMLSVGLVAIDSTILATAVPAIVDDLGGFAQFPGLFSIYLLAQAGCVPIFAKLTDLVGRKPVMLAGVRVVFLRSVPLGPASGLAAVFLLRAVPGVWSFAAWPGACRR